GPAPQPTAAERVHQFQRNCGLIQTLVQGGLRLAAEEDPLKRAECCSGVAKRLADELHRAAESQDRTRVVELGEHLNALLASGVAANLSTARRQIPQGSTLEKNLLEIRDQTALLVVPLEEILHRDAGSENGDEIQRTLKVLHDGRIEV